MKASRWLLLFFIASWSAAAAVTPVRGEDIYHGRVVDDETDKPLVGAAVTVIWFRTPILGLESTRDFHSAQETVTDSEGKFSLAVSPGIDWNPFTYIRKEPEIVIYQAGYEPTWAGWRIRNKFNRATDLAEALKKGMTIKLRKLESKEELARFADRGAFALPPNVPSEQIQNLIRLINVQRKNLGYESIY